MDSFEVKIDDDIKDIEILLKDLFQAGNSTYELLKQAIEREFRPNGAPDVKRMEVDRIQYDPASGKGNFRVVLDIDYTFGCEDLLKEKKNETSEWSFVVDETGRSVHLYSSPYIESRSTADEF